MIKIFNKSSHRAWRQWRWWNFGFSPISSHLTDGLLSTITEFIISTNFGSDPSAVADSCEGLWLDILLLGTLVAELTFPEEGADRDAPFRADELDCETATLWDCGSDCWGEHAKTHYDHMILNPFCNLNPRHSQHLQLRLQFKVHTPVGVGVPWIKPAWCQMSSQLIKHSMITKLISKEFHSHTKSLPNDL